MEWSLRLGKNLPALIRRKEAGKSVPLLDSRPILSYESSHFMTAFQKINGRRTRANGTEPISVQEIYSYCKLFGIDNFQDRSDIFNMVEFLDETFLAWNKRNSP